MRTPIVATDVGGTRELATHGVHGILVAPGDVPGLSAAIRQVLDDPAAAAARSNEARHRIEHDLSFQARTRRLEGIYEELARERDEFRTRRGILRHA